MTVRNYVGPSSVFQHEFVCEEFFPIDCEVPLIKNYISKIREKDDLDMNFYENAIRLSQYFWKYLHHTTDAVIVGLVSSIAVLCDYENYREQITINEICKTVNIRASTVNSRISNTIVKQLKIKGFKCPVKSHRLINIYLHKFNIILNQENNLEKRENFRLVEEPSQSPWEGFEDALEDMLVKINQSPDPFPTHLIPINVSTEGMKELELHIFQFLNTKNRQSKVLAVQLTPISREIKKTTDRFGYAAQKGSPWKDLPFINPG